MSFLRNIKFPVIVFLLAVLIGGGLYVLFSYILPDWIESRLISVLKEDVGITDLTLDLRELDLEGADLGLIRLGPQQNPALIIRSLQLDYAPGELYHKKIRGVKATGVEVYASYTNGRWGLRGLDLKKVIHQINATFKNDGTSSEGVSSFPHHIEINNGTIILEANGTTYRLPFEIGIVPDKDVDQALIATARLYLRGQPVSILAHIDSKQNQIKSELKAAGLELLRFADLVESVDGLYMTGSASLVTKANLTLNPLKVSTINGQLTGSALHLKYKGIHLRALNDTASQATPILIEFTGSGDEGILFTFSDLVLGGALAARLADFTATLNVSKAGFPFSGHFQLTLDAGDSFSTPADPIKFDKPFQWPLKFGGHLAQNNRWRVELFDDHPRVADRKQAAFQYRQTRLSFKAPAILFNAGGNGRFFDMDFRLDVPAVRAVSDSVNLFTPRFVLTGETNSSGCTARSETAKFNLNLSDSVVKTPSGSIQIKQLSVDSRLQIGTQNRPGLTGRIKFAGTRYEGAGDNIVLMGAKGSIPFDFPASGSGQKGLISIKSASVNQLNLGSIQAAVQQTISGLAFNGRVKNPTVPALSVLFEGTSEFGAGIDHQTRAQISVSYPEAGPEIDLGKIVPAAKGFTFSGSFWERGHVVIGKNGLQAVAKSGVQNGTLQNRQAGFAIEGVKVELFIPDVTKLRSAPGQKLTFTRAFFGGLNIDNGDIVFQIESPRSFLVEKSHFNWADGNVDAPAIRFRPDKDDYHLILYCDRLNLAKVLAQFGAASVEAQGELNGRIPIRINKGQLSFQDGFLFTTPGQPGKIRMTDTEILTAGIPPGTPQHAQMELARKALEDYDYTWARLNINTEGEELLLNMQLDGKPAQSLPFVYRKDMGGFAKVEAGVQGSKFQGIRLDINFRLPLNKIMQYKELIQLIQQSRE